MMKTILFLLLVAFQSAFCQIDYTKLIIGRNNGTHLLDNGDNTRIFGFAETLSEEIKLPGPTIFINEGDSVLIDFWNVSQGAPHTIHLHGLDVDQQNDGVPHLSFEVDHQEHGFYRFKAPHPGTYLYHCHVVSTIHVQAGMYGVIIVRPNDGNEFVTWFGGETYDRELIWAASEIDTTWHRDNVLMHDYQNGNPILIPNTYKPQFFLNNGKSGSQLNDPVNYYVVEENEKIFMRLVNIGYQGVRYIFPSQVNSRIISSDGRPLPQEVINDTVVVLPGERYGAMIETSTEQFIEVVMEHFDLNTQTTTSSQKVTIRASPVGISELIKNNSTSIYPNPSLNGLFYFSETINDEYVMINSIGKQIMKSNNKFIDLSNHPKGVYTIVGQGFREKVVKL